MSQKQEERREFWSQKIAQQDASGQSVRAFCKAQGLGEHSFYAWRQRLRKEGEPVRFALVETKPAAGASREAIELALSSGDRLLIPVDAATLRMVLTLLREA